MAKQDMALRREETSRTAWTTPYVVAGKKETRQLETLHDFKVEMTRLMTVPCATNGPVGKHVKFRMSSPVSKCGSSTGRAQWMMI